ncbi:sensor histidine kinase [Aureibacter tunicatorum]|uniref:Signal transduction histidine kinase internal region domain-containing protein n=1 Tax=Aureibacter tunicatorum TaxID=866807 RepID=A0AAE3XS95_9BACT|nr:histidine kinase [Aureibacter tunicatorum]MDR6241163.1 hypothetical protein [Aureibacter tunicatorum]BDD03938.1 hypothetical protein AUTU_14210 [Aureibacter tunicatorum]
MQKNTVFIRVLALCVKRVVTEAGSYYFWSMKSLIIKYKAFLIGFVIIPIFYVLKHYGFIIIPEGESTAFNIFTLFWGLAIALPIHFFTYLKKKVRIVKGVVSLGLLFFVALFVDSVMRMPDNPITLSLLLAFWLGLVYFLVPDFCKKYWKVFAIYYTPLFLYYLYHRIFSENIEAYMQIKEEFPIFAFVLPVPVFFIFWLYEQWKWLKNLKAEKAQAELALLRTQINPHFFFNTLNNLYALTIKNSMQAPEVILKLSDMMRYTIYEGEKELVSISDEIDYLNNYIELHQIRYKKSVDIIFEHEVNPEIKIAPLLFIILLENAFKHGVETLAENAFIHIRLHENAGELCFEIENNFDPEESKSTQGIGLQNLKKRLVLLYENQHELNFNTKEDVYSVTLKIARDA